MTFTYCDTHSHTQKKNQSGDWSVQIRVRSCGSHVTGFNFAQHTHVLPAGVQREALCAACKNCDTWPFKMKGLSHVSEKQTRPLHHIEDMTKKSLTALCFFVACVFFFLTCFQHIVTFYGFDCFSFFNGCSSVSFTIARASSVRGLEF